MPTPNHQRPSFLGIGAHKSGTTWLFTKLRQHTQVWMPPAKEVHFFSLSPHYPSPNALPTYSHLNERLGVKAQNRPLKVRAIELVAREILKSNFQEALWWYRYSFGDYDDNWYVRLFAQASSTQLTGEITPAYSILDSKDVKRIAAINPDMKLIFLLRNPIDRAWSAVRFYQNTNQQDHQLKSDHQIISYLKSPQVMLRTNYERTLDNYLSHFDSSQILIGFYDAIINDPIRLLSGITDFLNIEPLPKGQMDNKVRVNGSPFMPMSSGVRDYLLETYTPMIERLSKQLGSYATLWPSNSSTRIESLATKFAPVIHP